MSKIVFHTQDGTAELHGSERAYMSLLINDLTWGIVERDWERLLGYLPADCYILKLNTINRKEALKTWLSVGWQERLVFPKDSSLWAGVNVWSMALNTVLAMDSEFLTLLVRLHGQCEIHCWVQGHDRPWLAQLMERGLARNIYRHGQGWPGVIDLLRKSEMEPVVCSYSVTDSFPNPAAAGLGFASEDAVQEWYNLPLEVRWQQCLDELGRDYNLCLRQTHWTYDNFWLDEKVTVWDVLCEVKRLGDSCERG